LPESPLGSRLPAWALLLHYLALNLGMARETLRLAVYSPGAERPLRPLPQVNRALRQRLGAATEPDAQAEALHGFTRALDGILGRPPSCAARTATRCGASRRRARSPCGSGARWSSPRSGATSVA
jgi:hypothetical protein